VVVTEGMLVRSVYPNPISNIGLLSFATGQSEAVTVTLFDALGRAVKTLYNGVVSENALQDVRIDATGLNSGLYVLQLTGKTFSTARTISVVH